MGYLYDVVVKCTNELRNGDSGRLESEIEKMGGILAEDFHKALDYIGENLRGIEINTILTILDSYSKKYKREVVKGLINKTLKREIPKTAELALVGYD